MLRKSTVKWPSRDDICASMPSSFRELYPNIRAICDITEIPCEALRVQGHFRFHKALNSIKILTAFAPNGEVTFISEAFSDEESDLEIVSRSGILDLIEPDDLILAEKGFPNIAQDLNYRRAHLALPPFKTKRKEEDESASVRGHVDRCVARLKFFDILHFFPHNLVDHIDQIMHIIAFLAKMYSDLTKEVRQKRKNDDQQQESLDKRVKIETTEEWNL